MRFRLSWSLSFLGFLGFLVLLLYAPAVRAQSGVAGTYRCMSFNVGGRGGRCTSPPLVLQANGQYQMSSEHGTYTVKGNQIVLSESKIRGAGRLHDNEIVFEYTYRGLQQTVTYRREAEAAPPAIGHESSDAQQPDYVPVSVTIEFPESDGSPSWVNTAQLVPSSGDKDDTYETLAVTDGKQTVKAYFKAVATERVYTLLVGSGFENRPLARVDLRKTASPVKLTVQVPSTGKDRDRYTPPRTDRGSAPPPAP